MFPAAGRGRGPAGATGGPASHRALMGETSSLPSSTWAHWWGWQTFRSAWSRTGREPKHHDRLQGGTAIGQARRLQRVSCDLVPVGVSHAWTNTREKIRGARKDVRGHRFLRAVT
jgi:hypothetical protein